MNAAAIDLLTSETRESKSDDKVSHAEHRKRMRKRYFDFGPSVFQEHELLELLLFGAIPRENVNGLAHRLLDRFGSLPGLFRASPDMIKEVKGAGDQVALLISIVKELQRYLDPRDESTDEPLTNPDMWFSRFKPYYRGAAYEIVYMLSLDSSRRFIDIKSVGLGGETNAGINIRDVTDKALRSNASYAVLAHNHVNGTPEPSKQDVFTTSLVGQVFQSLNITLLDHLIIYGEDKYTSILNKSHRL